MGIFTHEWRVHGKGKNHKPHKDIPSWNKDKTSLTDQRIKKKDPQLLFLKKKRLGRHGLLEALAAIDREYKCEKCDTPPIWQGEKLTIQIDHIDGDRCNNDPSNLRFLCPNCHSQTETYGFRGKVKY